jgi:hypothetical protein
MSPDEQQPHPLILPSLRRLYVVALSPLLGAVAATLLVRINVGTTVAALAGAVAAMVRAKTFIISLHTSEDRLPIQGTFGMMYDRLPPPPLQHWYVPLIAGVVLAATAELLRTAFVLWKAHIPLTIQSLVWPAVRGVLDGAFVILVAVASWAVVSSLLLRIRRPRRAA